tara:strand:- start:196 stop:786 length:591 start_codon:yes stop_codon:yes gene_type:complete
MAEYITGKNKLSSDGGIASYADTNPNPVADDNGRDGWLWTKITAGATEFMNLYFYSEGNRPITLGEIHSINAVLSIDSYTDATSLPFLNIYTKPTGVGDAGAWYHSRINHTLKAGETIVLGEIIEAWGIKKDAKQGNTRQVNFNEQIRLGDCLDSEEIMAMSIIMGGDSPLGARVLVENLGYTLTNGVRIGLAEIV